MASPVCPGRGSVPRLRAAPVPFRDAQGLLERGLRNADGNISGRAQAAVRALSAADFARITALGLADSEPLLPRREEDRPAPGFADEPVPFVPKQLRERVQVLSSRILRDRVFRRIVLRAYDERCALSRLKLINGGGRAEVAAAHIRPVAHNGPDSVSNGLALSGTAHWMFDRGLIGLSDDLEILVSRTANDPDGARAFLNKDGRALPSAKAWQRPHPHFLEWHRRCCFKQ